VFYGTFKVLMLALLAFNFSQSYAYNAHSTCINNGDILLKTLFLMHDGIKICHNILHNEMLGAGLFVSMVQLQLLEPEMCIAAALKIIISGLSASS
jgi:hypothetical protein